MYNSRGFYINYILGNGKFQHMADSIMTNFKCCLNCTAVGKYVPESERAMRVIKDRVKCVINLWVYTNVPIIFKVCLIKFVVFWLN